jgi:methionyl-tRNA formyltransferase
MKENIAQYAVPLRVGLLTQSSHPLLPFWVNELRNRGIGPLYLIQDIKPFAQKDSEIFETRTDGYFNLSKHDNVSQIEDLISPSVPIFKTQNHNSKHCVELVNDLKLDLLVNCGTPRKLTSELLNCTRIGVLNVHPGILPKYRGSSAVEWSIYNGDKPGNTAHFMGEGYDDGNIILAESINLHMGSDYKKIRISVFEKNFEIMANAVEKIYNDKMTSSVGEVQDENIARTWLPMNDADFQIMLNKLHTRQ